MQASLASAGEERAAAESNLAALKTQCRGEPLVAAVRARRLALPWAALRTPRPAGSADARQRGGGGRAPLLMLMHAVPRSLGVWRCLGQAGTTPAGVLTDSVYRPGCAEQAWRSVLQRALCRHRSTAPSPRLFFHCSPCVQAWRASTTACWGSTMS